MYALGIIAIACFCLRLPYQSALEAAVSVLILLPLMGVAYRYGGWTSLGTALRWARANKVVTALEVIFVVMVPGFALVGAVHPFLFALAETVSSYFFLHAFGALGTWTFEKASKA